ncbi:hypothetical protein TI05_13395 [Achromatium sp. WMS3]|nr:hypothetical protein TI05_13395 [Achromatium sp. WMS3]
MQIDLEIQRTTENSDIPTDADLKHWVTSTLTTLNAPLGQCPPYDSTHPKELLIRIVNIAESATLNATYRHKIGATNVLSFPFMAPKPLISHLLGDIVICAPLVTQEALEQNKSVTAHWAHLVIHGILHLLGYDHQTEVEADIMENLERQLLANLDFPDPYAAIT